MGETLNLSAKKVNPSLQIKRVVLVSSLLFLRNKEEERFVSIKSSSLPPSIRLTLASTELAFNSISLEVLRVLSSCGYH